MCIAHLVTYTIHSTTLASPRSWCSRIQVYGYMLIPTDVRNVVGSLLLCMNHVHLEFPRRGFCFPIISLLMHTTCFSPLFTVDRIERCHVSNLVVRFYGALQFNYRRSIRSLKQRLLGPMKEGAHHAHALILHLMLIREQNR